MPRYGVVALQLLSGRITMLRVLIGGIVVVAFFAGRTPAVWSTSPQPASEVPPVIAPNVDVYGTPVEPAVGGYRVDFEGDLYEEHNPDTAVLELGSPSS